METMTIGVLARRAGMSVKAIREYADAGLIYTQARSAGGYRLFAEEALWCVEVIAGLRSLGLRVAEIRELANATEPVGPHLARLLSTAKSRTEQRLEELHGLLARIEAFEEERRTELSGEAEFDTADPRRSNGG